MPALDIPGADPQLGWANYSLTQTGFPPFMPSFQKLTLTDDQFLPDPRGSNLPLIAPADLTFVICAEAGIIGAQALLLCRSLRQFGGQYRDCAIVAVSPRPALAPLPGLLADLAALNVQTVILPLNQTGSTYGPINRVVAAAWAERTMTTAYIAVLDSDMLFVGPPEFVQADVGLRPVDTKGTATSGPADPMDAYWAGVFKAADVGLDRAPWLTSTTCDTRIRASYNGGFCVARRDLGMFQATERIFFAGFQAGFAPTPGASTRIFASTGLTTTEASIWWGSSQAALSAAVAAHVRNILIYPSNYNVPLHILSSRSIGSTFASPPVLIHYHHLSAAPYHRQLAAGLHLIGTVPEARDWVLSQCAALDWDLAG